MPEPASDLSDMLRGMHPRLRAGDFVFVTTNGALPVGLDAVMTFAEDEGLTAIVTADQADAAGLPYELVTAWITLQVHSALAGVGLTAAVSGALARAGISCNMVAAAFHDHLFVPADDAAEAMRVLQELSGGS